MIKKRDICVLTTNAALSEPRAPRHALWLKRTFPDAKVTLIDAIPKSAQVHSARPSTEYESISIPIETRDSSYLLRAREKVVTAIHRLADNITGNVNPRSVFTQSTKTLQLLERLSPSLVVAESIEALIIAGAYCRQKERALVFDSMEYFADMGEGQTSFAKKASSKAQSTYFAICKGVIAASNEIASELVREYGLQSVAVLRNVPDISVPRREKSWDETRLYWRNSVLAMSQRGLDDALKALSMLPKEVVLFLQGRKASDSGAAIARRASELGISNRVVILAPSEPDKAVQAAENHDIGLCLERRTCLNHELTSSNKIYDYHMAGLAVVASNMKGLESVLAESKGGIVYEAGNPRDLRDKILHLHENQGTLKELQTNARRYAELSANRSCEFEAFKKFFTDVLSS